MFGIFENSEVESVFHDVGNDDMDEEDSVTMNNNEHEGNLQINSYSVKLK